MSDAALPVDDGDNERSLFTSVDPGAVTEDYTVMAAPAGGYGAVIAALARKLTWLADLGYGEAPSSVLHVAIYPHVHA